MRPRRRVAIFEGMGDNQNRNEGEGSKSADKQYREAASDFAKRTDTLQRGLEAEREVERDRGEFEKAEREGRSHSAGDLPKDESGEDFNKK